ncbi:MAG: hypothetical protein M3Z23_09095 [Acidobacteriota bacterium]|nr:hypothetical protein [Acidobacteriota bacterium]
MILPEDFKLEPGTDSVLVSTIYDALKNSIDKHKRPLTSKDDLTLEEAAWRTRNLLELLIWTEYCTQSLNTALEFYREAVRDLRDVNIKGVPKDKIDAEVLAEIAQFSNVLDIEQQKLQHMNDVAETVKRKDFYSQQSKILSKCVHPTAMSIIAPMSVEGAHQVRQTFIETGLAWAEEANNKLDSSFLFELNEKYKPAKNSVLAAMLLQAPPVSN